MHKGDVVLVPFPFTDLSGQKVRPAVVLYAGRSEDCIVAFISSRASVKARGFSVTVPASRSTGLKFDSVARLDKLATLQKKIVVGKLGALDAKLLETVDAKLRSLFAL